MKELSDLCEQLEECKLVERATGMLMQQHHLREANAFNGMKAVTVNRRRPLRAIAEDITLAEQLGL